MEILGSNTYHGNENLACSWHRVIGDTALVVAAVLYSDEAFYPSYASSHEICC